MSENIAPNDVASAKVICCTNSIENDFGSAEVNAAKFIANGVASANVISTPTSNGPACDRPAYDRLTDTPSPIDTPPLPPYKFDELNGPGETTYRHVR